MHQHTPLISTIVVGLVLAFVLGAIANRFRVSPLVGYLLAGVLIGPFTPGYVADQRLANDLAEIGIILLMFGVGLHFTLEDLLSVRAIAVPGAIAQIASATALGMGLAYLLGWSAGAGLVFGLALSVASTVVLLRALQERRLVETERGRIAIGWLVVEDFVMILTLVLLPALAGILKGNPGAGASALIMPVLLTLAKVAAFVAVMLVIGKRVIPWLLHAVAHSGSRELFRLSVLAIALGVAFGASMLFDVSFALGAFFAGMILSESELSQRAAQESLPLRDAFAVLFFVSVGMLFEPAFLLREPLLLLAALAVVLVGKPLAALAVVALLGYSIRTALVVAIGLAQVGEFSFILGDLARQHGLLSDTGFSLLVACALVSISLNPILFASLDRIEAWLRRRDSLWRALNAAGTRRYEAANATTAAALESVTPPLAIVVGYGPVGRAVDEALRQAGTRTVVVDLNMDTVAQLNGRGRLAIFGDASQPGILEQAGLARASHLVVTLPHSVNRTPMIAAARQLNPTCRILVRARYLRERAELEQVGTTAECFEEVEAAVALTSLVLADLGKDKTAIEEHAQRVRREALQPHPGAA
jgi:CPA2 family monovalent cation:H+ antiporter-2